MRRCPVVRSFLLLCSSLDLDQARVSQRVIPPMFFDSHGFPFYERIMYFLSSNRHGLLYIERTRVTNNSRGLYMSHRQEYNIRSRHIRSLSFLTRADQITTGPQPESPCKPQKILFVHLSYSYNGGNAICHPCHAVAGIYRSFTSSIHPVHHVQFP
jgi:hypothetical protein